MRAWKMERLQDALHCLSVSAVAPAYASSDVPRQSDVT